MLTLRRLYAHVGTAYALLIAFALCPAFGAQDHVVSLNDIQKAAVAATGTREHDAQTVMQFMASPKAKRVLDSARLTETQVKTAVSQMSDQEVAQLASRVDKTQADFAAGGMADRNVILLVIAVVVLVLVIIAVR